MNEFFLWRLGIWDDALIRLVKYSSCNVFFYDTLVGFHEIVAQIFRFSVIKFLNRFCQFSFSVSVLHV